MKAPHSTFMARIRASRFNVLFFVLIGFIVLAPLVRESPGGSVVTTTLVSLILLAAIGCIQFKRRGIITTTWFGVFTLVSGWIPIFVQSSVILAAVALFRVGFLLTVTATLIYQVAVSKKVTLSVIVGAIDGYLMLGIVGAVAFAMTEILFPGSIQTPSGVASQSDFAYFSFITMLTVGYGEIVPVGTVARTIAMFLAVSGQMYIAILVAVLVGKFLASAQGEKSVRPSVPDVQEE